MRARMIAAFMSSAAITHICFERKFSSDIIICDRRFLANDAAYFALYTLYLPIFASATISFVYTLDARFLLTAAFDKISRKLTCHVSISRLLLLRFSFIYFLNIAYYVTLPIFFIIIDVHYRFDFDFEVCFTVSKHTLKDAYSSRRYYADASLRRMSFSLQHDYNLSLLLSA